MRIIAGYLGGRQFDAPPGHRTHPMSEKARGGLFNVLGDIGGLTVLDAFCGTGAISFEAISRGARSTIAVDVDTNAIATVTKNAKALGIGAKVKAIRANISGWSANNKVTLFDVVVCDPPHDNILPDQIEATALHVKPDGLFIVSLPARDNSNLNMKFPDFKLVQTKNYGDLDLFFYSKDR